MAGGDAERRRKWRMVDELLDRPDEALLGRRRRAREEGGEELPA